jgi:mxaK protein
MVSLKQLPLWFYTAALLLLAGTIYYGVETYLTTKLTQALNHPDNIIVDEHTPALLVFTKAHFLSENGNIAEAIRLYASLHTTEDHNLRALAFYNLATLYLQDGAKRWNAHGVLEAAHVSTEVELAKENYREALRLNPELWQARYNLEYAWRITPPPKEREKADFQGRKASIFSTLPGLPAGGP